jgi:hypothetical protein
MPQSLQFSAQGKCMINNTGRTNDFGTHAVLVGATNTRVGRLINAVNGYGGAFVLQTGGVLLE